MSIHFSDAVGQNNSEFFEDEDESFYNDITFEPLVVDSKSQKSNVTKASSTQNNHNHSFTNSHSQFNKHHYNRHNIENTYNHFQAHNNNNNHQNHQMTSQFYINHSNPYLSYNSNLNKLNFNTDTASGVASSSSQFQPHEQPQQDQHQRMSTSGRILSPAIQAKSVQVNRNIPFPGAQKRPPHLRINNDSWERTKDWATLVISIMNQSNPVPTPTINQPTNQPCLFPIWRWRWMESVYRLS